MVNEGGMTISVACVQLSVTDWWRMHVRYCLFRQLPGELFHCLCSRSMQAILERGQPVQLIVLLLHGICFSPLLLRLLLVPLTRSVLHVETKALDWFSALFLPALSDAVQYHCSHPCIHATQWEANSDSE